MNDATGNTPRGVVSTRASNVLITVTTWEASILSFARPG